MAEPVARGAPVAAGERPELDDQADIPSFGARSGPADGAGLLGERDFGVDDDGPGDDPDDDL